MIRQLSPLVANQIAAGEVVERPASVVKELLENAVDAGAQRIQIDIERGGTRLIRITDDGHGISEDELMLALARHATSKIELSTDLDAIETLGFRGEALASISSVARLTLNSKPKEQSMGCAAHAQGQDMAVTLSPVSIPDGTIVEVRDLFFNTPARQKFLRAERTEFVHIEETVKRVALASPEVAITLKHNGKVVKRIPAAHTAQQQLQRIGAIIGQPFIRQAISIDCELDGLRLYGWITPPDTHQSSTLSQYLFVNQRAVRDRVLTHAVRQAYQGLLPSGRAPAYVLYLNVPVNKVDVNVHPTKHEVRFSDSRGVHDFIEGVVRSALSGDVLFESAEKSYAPTDEYYSPRIKAQASGVGEPATAYTNMAQDLATDVALDTIADTSIESDVESESTTLASDSHFASAKTPVRAHYPSKRYHNPSTKKSSKANDFVLGDSLYILKSQSAEDTLWAVDLPKFCHEQLSALLQQQWQNQAVKQRMLLVPLRFSCDYEMTEQQIAMWSSLGFEWSQIAPDIIVLRKIPNCFEHWDSENWLQRVVNSRGIKTMNTEKLKSLLLSSLLEYWSPEEHTHWHEFVHYFEWQKSPWAQKIKVADLQQWLFRNG